MKTPSHRLRVLFALFVAAFFLSAATKLQVLQSTKIADATLADLVSAGLTLALPVIGLICLVASVALDKED